MPATAAPQTSGKTGPENEKQETDGRFHQVAAEWKTFECVTIIGNGPSCPSSEVDTDKTATLLEVVTV